MCARGVPDTEISQLSKALTVVLIGGLLLFSGSAEAQLRKIRIGDKMPEFDLPLLSDSSQQEPNQPDANMPAFTYKHDRARVLAVAFLAAAQKQSRLAAADIKKVLEYMRGKGHELDFVAVLTQRADGEFLELCKDDSKPVFDILHDTQYQLWGRLGIIAMPTVVVVGRDDKVQWVKAGYGYDFAPALRTRLSYALGILDANTVEDLTQVETLTNTTKRARVRRHLMMAKMLEEKGHLRSAVTEVRKAIELDPNSVEVAMELGELLCKANENQAALDVAEKIETVKKTEKARVLLISGWARRQMNELEAAEKLLLEATTLDPRSSRGFFELGKVYQTRKEVEKAMLAYYRALSLIFSEPAEKESSQRQ